MTLPSSEALPVDVQPTWRLRLERIARSRWTFVILQTLDLLTTLAAFRVGAFEVNPLVARFTEMFGSVRGVLLSKVAAIVIAMGVKKRLWIVNVFYTGIVIWNIFVLVALSMQR